MNNAVKKLEKLLKRERDNAHKKLDREWNKLCDKSDIVLDAMKLIDEGILHDQKTLEDHTEAEFQERLAKIKETHPDLIERHDMSGRLLNAIGDNNFFWEWALLAKCLKWYTFTHEEIIAIYAYYLNYSISGVLEFNIENNPDAYKKAEKEVKTKVPKIFRKIATNVVYKDFLNHARKDKSNIKHLRNVINGNGEIIPFEYAPDLIWIFEKYDFEIDKNIARAILEESKKKFDDNLEKEQAEKEKTQASMRASKERKERMAEYSQKLADANKGRRIAIQELKRIFDKDFSNRIISLEEISKIKELLKEAGYNETQIGVYVKSIENNNSKLEEEKLFLEINVIKNQCFSSIESADYVEANSIIEDPIVIKNVAYYELLNTYNAVHEVLLMLLNNKNSIETEDNIELLHLYMQELKTKIVAYKNSDYNYVQKLILDKEGE